MATLTSPPFYVNFDRIIGCCIGIAKKTAQVFNGRKRNCVDVTRTMKNKIVSAET